MCAGNSNCTSCTSCSKADGGTTYNPQAVGNFISEVLYEGMATDEQIKTAYPEVMIYLEANKLEPSKENIILKKEDLLKAIETRNGENLIKATDSDDFKKKALKIVVLAGVIFVAYKLFIK